MESEKRAGYGSVNETTCIIFPNGHLLSHAASDSFSGARASRVRDGWPCLNNKRVSNN